MVGASQANLRGVFRVADGLAMDQETGRADIMLIGTCNDESLLPPELRDRFGSGTWYVDQPGPEAQTAMWDWYCSQEEYAGHEFGDRPKQTDFTGRDIANIVDASYADRVDLTTAAETSNVPMARSSPETVTNLRTRAHRRYLDAAKPGVYLRPGSPVDDEPTADGERSVSLEDI